MSGKLFQRLIRRVTVRDNVNLNANFHVGWGSIIWAPERLVIGRDVYIGKNVTIQVDGVIGDQVLIGNCVGIVGKRDHEMSEVGVPIRSAQWVGDNPQELSDRVAIGSDVWIGYGATILSGVRVGNSSIIGAGSVVTRDVPDNVIVAGNPARVVRNRFESSDFDRHWEALKDEGVDWVE